MKKLFCLFTMLLFTLPARIDLVPEPQEPINERLKQDKKRFEERKSKILGSILGSAVGDALGRIPEVYWIRGGNLATGGDTKILRDKWRKDYPNGIRDFNDFKKTDFVNGVAIYTDDTQMARCVFDGLFEGKKAALEWMMVAFVRDLEEAYRGRLVQETMIAIAKEFAEWVVDPDGGLSGIRAPGIGSTRASRRLRKEIKLFDENKQTSHDWWAQGEGGELKPKSEGGCGSVMRAFPFGLMLSNEIDLACELSDKHSLLTHRAPIARAACAAMVAGMCKAMQNASPEDLLQEMIDRAKEIDERTAQMIEDAVAYANQNPTDEQIRDYLETLEGRLGSQAIAATAFVFACEHEDLLRAIRLAINFYGDSDSVGAMVGGLVGAYVGGDSLLDQKNFDAWLAPLEDREGLMALVERVALPGFFPKIIFYFRKKFAEAEKH